MLLEDNSFQNKLICQHVLLSSNCTFGHDCTVLSMCITAATICFPVFIFDKQLCCSDAAFILSVHVNETVARHDEPRFFIISCSSMSPTQWSSCSLEYLALAFEHGMDYCLRNKPQR
jgi:hypothetical protein